MELEQVSIADIYLGEASIADIRASASPDVINVLATTDQGTLAALQTTAAIARQRRLRIVLLVPDIVPFGIPINGSGHDRAALTVSYRDLAARVGADASVRTCPCRDARHVSSRLLLPQARIVLGGRRGRWHRSPEEQLAVELALEGHHVTFVDVDSGEARGMGVQS